jgi:hypothetical protein
MVIGFCECSLPNLVRRSFISEDDGILGHGFVLELTFFASNQRPRLRPNI